MVHVKGDVGEREATLESMFAWLCPTLLSSVHDLAPTRPGEQHSANTL